MALVYIVRCSNDFFDCRDGLVKCLAFNLLLCIKINIRCYIKAIIMQCSGTYLSQCSSQSDFANTRSEHLELSPPPKFATGFQTNPWFTKFILLKSKSNQKQLGMDITVPLKMISVNKCLSMFSYCQGIGGSCI